VPDPFPVLLTPRQKRDHPGCPAAVPWGLVAPHERQAGRNHGGQTLAALAARGGLDPVELLAVLDDSAYPAAAVRADPERATRAAVQALAARAARYSAAAGQATPVRAVPAWVWVCGFCKSENVIRAAGAGGWACPPVAECRFCRQLYAPAPDPAGAGRPGENASG